MHQNERLLRVRETRCLHVFHSTQPGNRSEKNPTSRRSSLPGAEQYNGSDPKEQVTQEKA